MNTYEIFKMQKGFVLVIHHEDGTQNDYRFSAKSELNRWMKLAGLK